MQQMLGLFVTFTTEHVPATQFDIPNGDNLFWYVWKASLQQEEVSTELLPASVTQPNMISPGREPRYCECAVWREEPES